MWGYGPYGMAGYGGSSAAGWMMMFGGILWLVLLAAAVAAIVYALRGGARFGATPPLERRSAGLDILEQRYARGEIQREEYLQKKRDLLEHGTGGG